ncbi:hypothetical protein EYF80_036019 [Liparis tanakae]|uniref:Uncharacterized protein n=1 Tax=Liparis tanakae TaxID=230148 RepID=A0A4Z2GM76_9TELE|nr:hypothetical protein EYF80_036019 [Liparis tanakae]
MTSLRPAEASQCGCGGFGSACRQVGDLTGKHAGRLAPPDYVLGCNRHRGVGFTLWLTLTGSLEYNGEVFSGQLGDTVSRPGPGGFLCVLGRSRPGSALRFTLSSKPPRGNPYTMQRSSSIFTQNPFWVIEPLTHFRLSGILLHRSLPEDFSTSLDIKATSAQDVGDGQWWWMKARHSNCRGVCHGVRFKCRETG